MANDKNQSKGIAEKAVDAAQKRSENQNSKANKAVDKAQEKGFVRKAQNRITSKFGKGSK